MSETVLVYGGAGLRGRLLVAELLARGVRVRVLAVDESERDALDQRVDVQVGDIGDRATVRRASDEVDAVVLQLPLSVVSFDVAAGAVDAAAEHGARVVFVTNGPAAPATGVASVDLAHAVQEHVRTAPRPGITLRTTLYLGNLAAPWTAPRLLDEGILEYPLPGDARVAWIAAEDAARMIADTLQRPDLSGRVLQMAGPRPLSGDSLAEEVGLGLGRPVRYAPLAPSEFGRRLAPFLGERAAQAVAELYRYLDESWAAHLEVATSNELTGPRATAREWAIRQPWLARPPERE